MTAADIIGYARECMGTPFAHQGRVPGLALDCAGLCVHVAQRLGYQPKDVIGYSAQPSPGSLESALADQLCVTRVAETPAARQAGDVLLMRFRANPQHLAIFTGENIIHSYSTVGKVVEHRLDGKWESRIVAVYRFAGMMQ